MIQPSLGSTAYKLVGASVAANAGIPDRLSKSHSRWWSVSAKDGYVKDSQEALMSVSKSLKLCQVSYPSFVTCVVKQ